LRVPRDISVLGFDDITAASMHHPPLTTIHQPLRRMGQVAASTLLSLIRNEVPHPQPEAIIVYPKLVVRKSTGLTGPLNEASSQSEEAQAAVIAARDTVG
jgi:DNA-binding LacI/PurR family transcriptional regulator